MRLDNSDLIDIRDRAKAVWADIHHFTNGGADSAEAEECLTDTRDVIKRLDKAIHERRTAYASKQDDDEMQRFLAGCIGAVEANRFEYHALWRFNDEKMDGRKLTWKQNCSGLMTCVGTIGGKETWISLNTSEVGGHKILFYHPTSSFVDHDAVRAWIDGTMPVSAREGEEMASRVNHTDAMNFHNIFPHGLERTYADA